MASNPEEHWQRVAVENDQRRTQAIERLANAVNAVVGIGFLFFLLELAKVILR